MTKSQAMNSFAVSMVLMSLIGCNSGGGGSSSGLVLGQQVSGTVATEVTYTLQVEQGKAYILDMETLSGDADITILDASSTEIASSWGTLDREVVGFIAPSSGVYTVIIDNADGAGTLPYTVMAKQGAISAGVEQTGNFVEESVYYRFDSNGGAFTVDAVPLSGDVDLQVWLGVPDKLGQTNLVGSSLMVGSDSVTVNAPSETATPYYIQLIMHFSPAMSDYSLTVIQ